MAKHAAGAASTTTKSFATAGLALGLASFGLFAGSGTAVADGHDVLNPDGTFGAADVNNGYGNDIVPAVQSYVTSSYPAPSKSVGTNAPHTSYPAGGSYSAPPSWPDNAWGVVDD